MAEVQTSTGLPWQLAGEEDNLVKKRCQRLHAKRGKRHDLVLLYIKDTFYAMEGSCSHAGGPLYEGDIEDYKGRPHIMCPWHGYLFDAETGKNEIGIMQEMFATKVENGQVYIQYKCELSTSPYKNS